MSLSCDGTFVLMSTTDGSPCMWIMHSTNQDVVVPENGGQNRAAGSASPGGGAHVCWRKAHSSCTLSAWLRLDVSRSPRPNPRSPGAGRRPPPPPPSSPSPPPPPPPPKGGSVILPPLCKSRLFCRFTLSSLKLNIIGTLGNMEARFGGKFALCPPYNLHPDFRNLAKPITYLIIWCDVLPNSCDPRKK